MPRRSSRAGADAAFGAYWLRPRKGPVSCLRPPLQRFNAVGGRLGRISHGCAIAYASMWKGAVQKLNGVQTGQIRE
jgi:hypothetical protein